MSSSSSYEQFAHLRIPLKEIASATNNFSDENLIRGSELGKAYRGQLLLSEQVIDIVAQRFDHEHRHGEVEFLKEISVLSTLKHKNLVSMVGFCDESGKIIIYKHEANGSLDSFLRDPTLTWTRRLQICVGVAHALGYIHYDIRRDFSVIHCDIRSSKILLDDNWEAKLSGFELSLNLTADRRNDLCFTDVCGTRGYRDPTFDKSASVTHKSDMYSFGIVLYEVLCGKEAVDEDNRLLAPFAKSHYEGRRLDDMIDPGLRKQMDPQSFQIFSEIAFYCLKEQRSQRPNIGLVAMKLEKALESQWEHEDRLRLKASVESTRPKNFKGKNMKHLEIPLIDIKTATENFAKTYLIGSGTYGDVYKAELDHYDSKHFLPLEEKINTGERPKKRSTVAIKRIKIRQDQQGEDGFHAEIEMLTSCKHPNVVSLLGYCKEDGHMILVYEYASNGSLQTYMGSTGNLNNLTWKQRIKICIDIARGLNYIHTKIEDERRIIHRDIKSDNILLSENWEAKIADFGLSRFRPENQQVNTFYTKTVAGTDYYLDPEYDKTGKLNNKTDIYSFGVVLFEMLSGRLANDRIYINENSNGIAHVARRRFSDRTIKEMVDPRLWKETHGKSFTLTKGPNQYALHAYLEISYQCVAETQAERPTAEVIIKKLEEASSFQEGSLEHLEIPVSDILSATENFANTYLIGSGTDGEMYKAELDHFDSKSFLSFEKKNQCDQLPKKRRIVAIKRILTREDNHGEKTFHEEIEMLTSCNHPNIVSLLGFCAEGRYMILVYEHASNGSLDDYLGSTDNLNNLSWAQRIRICIDIARGLNYLHTKIEDDLRMIHFDIKSGNILLGENWEAKIAGIKLSKIHPADQHLNSFYSKNITKTQVCLDSEYDNTGELKNDTDIYSFGVVLFEIMSGRFANDPIYTNENSNGIVPIACRRFNEGTMREMVDPRLMEETHVNTLYKGPGEDSLDAFSKIAYQCVTEHPTVEVIVKKLEEALYFQENIKDHLKFSLEYILLATKNFSQNNLIGEGGFGSVYIGEVTSAHGDVYNTNTIAVKRLDKRHYEGDDGFLEELQTLFEYKHENIIGIVGYCIEKGENIIVYEYAPRGRLDKYLKDNGVTWMRRLQICIDIASGLDFLHAGGVTQEVVIHRDMKTYNVLLDDSWKAKVSAFGLSLIRTANKEMASSYGSLVVGTVGYVDPLYAKTGIFTKESDIYSFGVVLIEILSGRLVTEYISEQQHDLTHYFKCDYEEDNVDEMVFEGIKEQIAPKSLTTFVSIAYQCLRHAREERPTTGEVLRRLKEALEFQEDYEMWEPKLPNDYKEIIRLSNSQEIYSAEKKKDLYDILSKGILLQQGKMLFSLGGNGEKNQMISARMFSYKNRWSHKWRSVPYSRFHKVAEILDLSNLKIQIKIKAQSLSLGVNYGVHLVFRFCGPRKSVANRMYVNLKYKKGNETLHAYFATWRKDGWMTIELCQFLNHKQEDTEFEFLLESFSRCYCESRAIYFEGIEFRAIDNVKNGEIKEIKEVQQVLQSDLNMGQQLPTDCEKQDKRFGNNDKGEKLLSLNEVNKKKHYTLWAKDVLYKCSDVKLFKSKPSDQSRFQDQIELQRQQVFRIKYKTESQRLSPDTEYACYLVFKLSEKCRGLHCPVIVRDLLQHKNNEKGIIYFRSPSPCNVNDTDRVPEEREDGWMEVKVRQFNSSNELRGDFVSINLKLISYQGTMCGLIVRSLEFWPM